MESCPVDLETPSTKFRCGVDASGFAGSSGSAGGLEVASHASTSATAEQVQGLLMPAERLFRRDGIGDIGFGMFHISGRCTCPLIFEYLGIGARTFNVTNTQCMHSTDPLFLGVIVLERKPTHGQSFSGYLNFRRRVCPRKGSHHPNCIGIALGR